MWPFALGKTAEDDVENYFGQVLPFWSAHNGHVQNLDAWGKARNADFLCCLMPDTMAPAYLTNQICAQCNSAFHLSWLDAKVLHIAHFAGTRVI